MKIKRLLSVILVLCMMLVLFAACAEKEPVLDEPSAKPSSNVPDNGGDVDDIDPDEIDEINFWFGDFGTDVSMIRDVEAAINEITEKEIGVRINLTTISVADYGTQLNLAIANNESVDIATYTPIPSSSWLNFYSSGAIYDMTGLIDEYGQDIKALFGDELLGATKVDGKIFGLSNYRQLNSNTYLVYRTDILEQCGVLDDMLNLKTWADFEAILEVLKNEAGMYAIGGSADQPTTGSGFVFGTSGNLSDVYSFDTLGDTLRTIYTDQNGNVSNLYEVDDCTAGFKYVADWASKGYVYPDAAVSTEQPENLILSGVMAGYICASEFGIEANKSQSCGYDMTCVMISSGMVSANGTRNFGLFIPSTSAEPESAMKFLNLLYNSAELMNLLDWGIEGVNYVVNDGIADYPEGKDISNCGWHVLDFVMGNQFLATTWAGSVGGASFRDDAYEDFMNAPRSVYMGLSVDLSDYDTLISSLNSVKAEYYYQLTNGQYSDKLFSEFMQKQTSAGVEEYVALYQNAVSEYMA